MLIFIIIIVISLILFFPLKIRIIRNDYANDVKLYIIKSLNLSIDLDELINIVAEDKNNSLIINLIKVYKSKNFIKTILKFSNIKKLTFVVNTYRLSEELNVVQVALSWIVISNIRNIIYNNFKMIKNEYYSVNSKKGKFKIINVDVILEIRLVYFIFSLLLNIRYLPTLINSIKKGNDLNEQPSN